MLIYWDTFLIFRMPNIPDFPDFFIFPVTSEKKQNMVLLWKLVNTLTLMTNIVFWIVEIVINNSKFNQFNLKVILGFVGL